MSSTCAQCASPRLTEIRMTLTDGSPVHFVSCRACETRAWRQGDRTLPFTAVLDKTRKVPA